MKTKIARDSSPLISLRRARVIAPSTLLVLLYAHPAFAGTSGSTMGQKVVDGLNEYVGFMTGPIVPVIAIIAAAAVLIGALMTGANGDTMKKLVVMAGIVAAICSMPSLVNGIVSAAGGMI